MLAVLEVFCLISFLIVFINSSNGEKCRVYLYADGKGIGKVWGPYDVGQHPYGSFENDQVSNADVYAVPGYNCKVEYYDHGDCVNGLMATWNINSGESKYGFVGTNDNHNDKLSCVKISATSSTLTPTALPTQQPILITLNPTQSPTQQEEGCKDTCDDGIKSCLELTGNIICNNCKEDNSNCKTYDHRSSDIVHNSNEAGGCKECKDGYFMKNKYYPCVSCKDNIKGCMKCQDYQGCVQCDNNGYQWYWDNNCKIGKCRQFYTVK